MNSLVLELQHEVCQQNISVTDLLRKTYLIASKLEVADLKKWAYQELNGYYELENNLDDFPKYRVVHGLIKAFSPPTGKIPVEMRYELDQKFNKRVLFQSISEIEAIIKTGIDNGKGILEFDFQAEFQVILRNINDNDFRYSLTIPVTQFQLVVEKVKNVIMEWTVKLEEEGVLGEGMLFSDKDKERASNSNSIIINIIGNMDRSQLQQNTLSSEQLIYQENDK